jgi:MraZ protein
LEGETKTVKRKMMDYFERKLDDKHRLTIPAELRQEFPGGKAVITRGFGSYLHLYPRTVWDEEVETALRGEGWQLDRPAILSQELADTNVALRTGKAETSLDGKQGRITLEKHQLEYAGITQSVVAVRAGKYWRLSAK